MADAENITIEQDEEGRAWRDQVFGVASDGSFIWPEVACNDEDTAISFGYMTGQRVALDLIGHLRDYSSERDHLSCRLVDVLRALIERGRFDAAAVSFAIALGDHIADGKVHLGYGWEARHGERT